MSQPICNQAAAARSGRRPLRSFAFLAAGILWLGSTGFVHAQTASEFTPADEAPEDYPEGAGREETFYSCTACHGFKLVAQQGQSRRQWDETLDFMTQKHNMPALADDDRKLVLDYLEATFPPRAPTARGRQNPFLNR